MPYPSQVNREAIIETTRQMIEADGVEKLSLRLLADALGVKAPSLYRHVANKMALLHAVNIVTTHQLIEILYAAVDPDAPVMECMVALAHAFRQFAHENPACYALAYANPVYEIRPDADEREALVLPLQSIFAELVGEDNAFAAIRGAYAFLHGWAMLEITQQFEREGDLDSHFETAFRAYLAGWGRKHKGEKLE
jgi:AcrR family transcriptional regulator